MTEIGDQPFYVYLPSSKFGSENIYTLYLWSRIRSLNFQGFITISDNPSVDLYIGITCVVDGGPSGAGSHILVIDDSVYIGNNALSIIDEITYANKGRHSKQNPIYFHLVIPFVSTMGKEAILTFSSKDQFPIVTLYPTEVMIPLRDLWSGYTEELMERFKLEFIHQIPLYFDHRVANEFSTFEPIYMGGIIPGQTPFGTLLPIKPDTDLKQRIYNKYFAGLLRPPQ